jgi:pyrroline-5-carboxylate reductase
MNNLRVCFLGTGSMGSAVLDGLLRAGHESVLISMTTKSEQSAQNLRARGLSALAIDTAPDANVLLAADADLIVLGVKPAQILPLLAELNGQIGANAVVVSMAAGIELASMSKALRDHPNIIRTMPNTPALVRQGVTGLAPAPTASPDAIAAATELFEAVGSVVVVPEEKLNALSAISGSGPAWVYFMIEQWEQIALDQGFSPEAAKVLVRETFAGASALLAAGDIEPRELRRRVTSPGGTTEQIIGVLERADLLSTFERALQAAVARAVELSRG